MLIHLGENNFVSEEKLIMILNKDTVISDFMPKSKDCKSIVILDDSVIYSPIDSRTLKKRDDVLSFWRK